MDQHTPLLIAELQALISNLGNDGGLVSPSIYDTAQVLRLAPPADGDLRAQEWLLAQQQPDGGWGDAALPRARDVPTLATLLALHAHQDEPQIWAAIQAGTAFLRSHAPEHWSGSLSDDLPVGIELLLPHLLDAAIEIGLDVPHTSYALLYALGQRRRKLIASKRPRAGTSPVHSWEAWGLAPDLAVIDGSGGIGHSPAATAAWLRAAADDTGLSDAKAGAQHYLERAAAATGLSIPGVVPTVWPITRFEHVWLLYTLANAGLLEHPQLREVADRQLSNLASALQPPGIGMSDDFMYDGDITATTIATLKAAGYPADSGLLEHFKHDDHFRTYPNELQLSLTTTAHAVHALGLSGIDTTRQIQFLAQRQGQDGLWAGDKWHSSWLYTTAQVMIALAHHDHFRTLPTAVSALLEHQHEDGGWGMGADSTITETAYVTLALALLWSRNIATAGIQSAIRRAADYLRRQYTHSALGSAAHWLGKELYRPYRVDGAFVLSALLTITGEQDTLLERAVVG
jgi:halimadienyl-diphosphate synthase